MECSNFSSRAMSCNASSDEQIFFRLTRLLNRTAVSISESPPESSVRAPHWRETRAADRRRDADHRASWSSPASRAPTPGARAASLGLNSQFESRQPMRFRQVLPMAATCAASPDRQSHCISNKIAVPIGVPTGGVSNGPRRLLGGRCIDTLRTSPGGISGSRSSTGSFCKNTARYCTPPNRNSCAGGFAGEQA